MSKPSSKNASEGVPADKANHRVHPRVPVTMEVQYRSKGSFLVSYSLNLSMGGFFLETTEVLPVGSTLGVRFAVPGAEEPIETQARVAWVRPVDDEEGLPPGLGLQLSGLEESVGDLIDNLVRGFAGVVFVAVANDSPTLERLGRYLRSMLTCEVALQRPEAVLRDGLTPTPDVLIVDVASSAESVAGLVTLAQSASPPVPTVVLADDKTPVDSLQGTVVISEHPPTFERLRRCVLDALARPVVSAATTLT